MPEPAHFYYLTNPFARENTFRAAPPEQRDLPTFEQARTRLPQPFWGDHPDAIACYWRTWGLAFRGLRQPTSTNGFVANYIDTAFFDSLFMWDSVFILLFARYGRRAFPFHRTLDNFYAKQEADGFICKEFRAADGRPGYERFDPNSTGPNVLAWAEWEHWETSGDRNRLARVFPALVAYHQWLRAYRTWPDGSYWATGIASGMDNQPRASRDDVSDWNAWRRPPWARVTPANWPDDISWLYHAHLTWIDATLQQIFSAKLLLRIARELDRADDIVDTAREVDHLTAYCNARLWDDTDAFLYDRRPDGTRSNVKTVGAFWALLADVLPPDRRVRFVAHLNDPRSFNRPHRVPSIPADHLGYHAGGGYWLGSVWPPTNYMILRGLTQAGEDTLAHTIARNHLDNVVQTFRDTGTLWENYAPERVAQGNAAQPDFVGWGGLVPVAGLLEYVFGLRLDVPNGRLVWDIRLLEEHGAHRYPFGNDGLIDLQCSARSAATERPRITAIATVPVQLEVRWGDDSETLYIQPE